MDQTKELVARANWLGLVLLQGRPEVKSPTKNSLDISGPSAGSNTAISPASLQIALSMLGEGAKGQTLSDLETLLGVAGSQRQEVVNSLLKVLAKYEGDPAVVKTKELPKVPVLHEANNLVLNRKAGISPKYLAALDDYCGDNSVAVADFASAEGKMVLDAWANKHTGGLVPASGVSPEEDTFMVLQNAVVSAAAWSMPFEPRNTRVAPFYLADGSKIETETMHDRLWPKYVKIDGWQAIRLSYTEGFYADFILPPKRSVAGDDTAAEYITAAESITAAEPITEKQLAKLTEALSQSEGELVAVSLPKFKLKTKLKLNEYLQALGIEIIGDTKRADFSGIPTDPELELYLGQAAQQTVLQVDEAGTVAAALTELGPTAACMAEYFTADHPFLMRIGEDTTDWTVFMAVVANPAES